MKRIAAILTLSCLCLSSTTAFALDAPSEPAPSMESAPGSGELFGASLLGGVAFGVTGYLANSLTFEDPLYSAVGGLAGAGQWGALGMMAGIHALDPQVPTSHVLVTGLGGVLGAGAGLASGFMCGVLIDDAVGFQTAQYICAPAGFLVGAGITLGAYHLGAVNELEAGSVPEKNHAVTGLVVGSVVGAVAGNAAWRSIFASGVATENSHRSLVLGGGVALGLASAVVGHSIGSRIEAGESVSFAPMITDEGHGVTMFGRF